MQVSKQAERGCRGRGETTLVSSVKRPHPYTGCGLHSRSAAAMQRGARHRRAVLSAASLRANVVSRHRREPRLPPSATAIHPTSHPRLASGSLTWLATARASIVLPVPAAQ